MLVRFSLVLAEGRDLEQIYDATKWYNPSTRQFRRSAA